MAEPPSIEALLSQIALGDRAAFEALYRATADRLFGICLRVLNNRAEAEEVLQEVFVSIWRKAAQFDAQRAGALTWLGMMTRNRCIDRLREEAVRGAAGSIALATDIPDPDASPAQEAEAQIDRRRLEACVEQLEDRRRSLIRSAFFEGSTYEELAARVQAPLGSVKSWIRRGLLQLRACLES
ncbi:MAG TPA: sigma-70 family RNA polymerase sigma factor [Steroidobacteraceae bacterium]|nr:sigma-70 family RNA polymerase sigma factor [Steroidobacteraceae bacterium]